MHKENINPFLVPHLNVAWLRPESALWDTIASTVVSRYGIVPPSLDLGCGNGIFSFITAGGEFTEDYDWYINVNTEAAKHNKDMYDAFRCKEIGNYIKKPPRYSFTFGLDHKESLLKQAGALHFYEKIIRHDANRKLPFREEEVATVFSNILYWLDNPSRSLKEVHRILRKDGKALLCIPNTNFFVQSFTYSWKEKNSEILRLLNMGRSRHIQWTISYSDFLTLAKEIGFKVVAHTYYLSPAILKIWDIGTRPLSRILIKMANSLAKDQRRQIKSEWVKTVTDFFFPLLDMERKNSREGVFHFFVLKK